MVSSNKVWRDRIFCIPKKVIPVETGLIEVRVQQGLFEPTWGPYRNGHIPVRQKNGKYIFIISAVSANQHRIEDTTKPPNVEEFSEAFAGLPISSLIQIHSGYHKKILHTDRRDYMAFQALQSIYQPTSPV